MRRPAAPAKAPDTDPQGPNRAAVAAQVQPLVDAEILRGVVVGLYDAGKREIYGFGAGPGGARPDGRTLFEIGSVTKVYTALLLADAVQRREVELDLPVADLLPPGVTAPTQDGKTITLRHLVMHSSGLPRLPPLLLQQASSTDPYAAYDENALYADLVQTQLEAAPGERISYSNYGVGLLGFVLGKKLGAGYRTAIETRIIEPLGLADTFFTVPASAAARRAEGTNDDLAPVPPWTWDALAGAGALVSSVRDQLALIDAELDAAAGGKRALRRAMAFTQEAQLSGDTPNAGLGWQIDREGRHWHNGGTGGFHAFVGFDVKHRRGVVVLASTSTSLVDRLAARLYKILAGEAVAAPVVPTGEQLAAYAGTYELQGTKLQVIAQGKRLYVEGPGEPRIRMLPISDHEFWIEPLQSVVAFEREGDAITRAIFVIGEHQMSAQRVP